MGKEKEPDLYLENVVKEAHDAFMRIEQGNEKDAVLLSKVAAGVMAGYELRMRRIEQKLDELLDLVNRLNRGDNVAKG